jgi:hypothetical protein
MVVVDGWLDDGMLMGPSWLVMLMMSVMRYPEFHPRGL